MKKFLLIMIVLYTFLVSSFSQILNPVNDVFPVSANAAKLGFYNKQNVNMYTGGIDVNIPLYNIEVGKINIPLSLQYNSTGVKINQPTGWVGMGWTLNTGGAITRNVKNIPDEWWGKPIDELNPHNFQDCTPEFTSYSSFNHYGFFYSGQYATKNLTYIHNKWFIDSKQLDLEPDIFYFNFGGYSGRFFCTNNTNDAGSNITFYTVPNYNFKIECNIRKSFGINYIIDQIFITTADGTKYEFGSDTSNNIFGISEPDNTAIEYSTSSGNEADAVSTAWYLKKITTTTNQSIKFNYKTKDNQSKRYISESMNKYYKSVRELQIACSSSHVLSYNFTYQSYLSSIETDNEIVDFKFSDYPFRFSPWTYRNGNGSEQKLESIIVKNKKSNNEIKKITFCYDDPDRRLTLRSINLIANNEANSYKLYYKDQNKLPKKFTDCFDHWGYLISPTTPCSKPKLEKLQGYTYYNSQKDNFVNKRGVDLTCSGIGQLEKIEYPTGASSTFEYEPNQYWCVSTNSFGYAGGVRVKSITEHNSNGESIIRKYEYSEGRLGKIPYYGDYDQTVISSVPLNLGSSFGSDIGYSVVTEVLSDGSKTVFNFSNFDQFKDIPDIETNFSSPLELSTYLPSEDETPYTSFDYLRGKIDSIQYFDKRNQLIKSVIKKYDSKLTYMPPDMYSSLQMKTVCVAKLFDANQVRSFYSYYYLFAQPSLLSSEKTVEFFNGQRIESTTQYIYSDDNYFNLKEQKISNSKGQVNGIKFSYPVDYASQQPFTAMIQKNIISPVVSKQEFMGTKKTKEIQVEFYDASNFFLPKLEKEWNTDNTYRTSFNFDTYDSKGNLTQYHTKSDLYTTLLYGYNNSLPVAKIENCKVTDISPSSLISEVGSSYSNSEIKTKLDVIKSSKTDAYITSYVYNADNKTPVEIKSPANISTYYNYDGWNRLHTVKNNDVKTTVQYKYNLTETIPVSQLSCPENSNSEPNIDEEYYYIDYELTQAPNTITICKITEDDVPFNEYESLKDGKTYKVNFNHNLNEPYYLDLYFGAEYMGEKQEDTQINLTEHYASYNSGYYMFTTNDITCWKINQKMNYFIQKYGTKKELDYFLIIKAVTSSGEMISESDRLPFTPQICN